MEFDTELYGDCSIEELKRGYIEEDECYTCILCGEHFMKGEIYTFNGHLYEAAKATQVHVKEQHESVKSFLLGLRASKMGISNLQLQLLNFFASGIADKDIAEYLGVSGSTIRNHRFKLREKERQCRLFIALMELLQEDTTPKTKGTPISLSNYSTNKEAEATDKERKRVIEKYLTPLGRLKSYPSYERSKKIVLETIIDNFRTDQKYSEQEIDEILDQIYKDYHLLKEELIAYDYLGRSNKGGIYWIKNHRHHA